MRYFLVLMAFISCSVCAKDVLNVYNWADYMPAKVIQQFEKETNIQINYTEYDSNETMYAKLKSNPHLGYDVIFPSSYYVPRMQREHMLIPIEKEKLDQFKNLNKLLLNQTFDPHNQYSLPYLWGTTAIVVNKRFMDPAKVTGWNTFWSPTLRNQLLLFDDMREVFAIALFRLGYSINDTDPAHIRQAYESLKLLWPNVKLLSVEAEQNVYIDEDAYIGMGLNGEIFNATSENPNLTYIYPKEGFEVWMDCMSIPINAPHKDNALKFINFLLRPDIAKQIALYTGFSTPNLTALHQLPINLQNNKIINPPASILKRGEYLKDLDEVNAVYEGYWNQLKISS